MSLHRARDRRFAPWKNGGGETAEILCHPPGAGYDDFRWRISTARVAQSGPFSTFEGVTRVLTVLDGGSMTLRIGDAAPVTLGPGMAPLRFAGDLPCDCTLHGAPLLDLNVMLRGFDCDLRPATLPATSALRPLARLLFALADLPAQGLQRFDLQELSPDHASPLPEAALIIDILPFSPGA